MRIRTAVVTAVVVIVGGLQTSTAVSAVTAEPQPTVLPGPLPAGWTENTAQSRALACVFEQKGDNVHRSGTDASGQGWWVAVSGCQSGQTGTVTVSLQQYYSDGQWRTVSTGSKPGVYAGGGSANRAVARRVCSSSQVTTWRSVIDVDLAGIIDSPNKTYTGAINITCRAL